MNKCIVYIKENTNCSVDETGIQDRKGKIGMGEKR